MSCKAAECEVCEGVDVAKPEEGEVGEEAGKLDHGGVVKLPAAGQVDLPQFEKWGVGGSVIRRPIVTANPFQSRHKRLNPLARLTALVGAVVHQCCPGHPMAITQDQPGQLWTAHGDCLKD